MNRLMLVVLTASILAVSGSAQQKTAAKAKQDADSEESCRLHSEHMKQQAADKRFHDMNLRGAKAMGFDQTKTTHHFRSFENGGAIEVTVQDPADTADLEAIRNHLSKIAREFTSGDFSVPAMTHAEMPAGASAMRTLRDRIKYEYEEVPNGARVRITTTDAEALHAIDEFLSYQVGEHRTGD
jgi:TusA-related sulfurtransferase